MQTSIIVNPFVDAFITQFSPTCLSCSPTVSVGCSRLQSSFGFKFSCFIYIPLSSSLFISFASKSGPTDHIPGRKQGHWIYGSCFEHSFLLANGFSF